jgi:outer membrane receptor protein involved in Fe transport
VTVTATAIPTLESHLGAAVTVLGSNQVAGTDEIQEPLRWIPGVQMTQTGRLGGTTALYIRGGNSDANKVLIDGIPMNDMGGAVEFADISSAALSRVEVLRGPNSSVYGADAMAGVVSLTTRSGSTPLPELMYTGDAGNFSSFRNEASAGGKWKIADYFVDFARLDTSNGIPNDRFHIGTASANFGWNLFSNSALRATLRHDKLAGGQPSAILLYGIADDAKQVNEDSYFGATFECNSLRRTASSVELHRFCAHRDSPVSRQRNLRRLHSANRSKLRRGVLSRRARNAQGRQSLHGSRPGYLPVPDAVSEQLFDLDRPGFCGGAVGLSSIASTRSAGRVRV